MVPSELLQQIEQLENRIKELSARDTQLIPMPIYPQTTALNTPPNYNATSIGSWGAAQPVQEYTWAMFGALFLIGATNNITNYWQVDLVNAAGATVTTITTALLTAGAGLTRVQTTIFSINPSPATNSFLRVNITKVGTPSDTRMYPYLYHY